MKHEVKVLKIDEKVDEVQVWCNGDFVGAGAWTKPYDKDEAAKKIINVWVGV